jgi:hypothetical protein
MPHTELRIPQGGTSGLRAIGKSGAPGFDPLFELGAYQELDKPLEDVTFGSSIPTVGTFDAAD